MATNHNIKFEHDENGESYFTFKGFKVFSNSNTSNLSSFLAFLDGAPPTAFTRIKHICLDGDVMKVFWVDDINKSGFKSESEIIGDYIVFKSYVAGFDENGSENRFKIQNWVKKDEPEELEEPEKEDKSKPMIFDKPFNWDNLPVPKKGKLDLPDIYKWPGKPAPSVWGKRDTSGSSLWDKIGK